MNVIKFPGNRVGLSPVKTRIQADKSCGNCDHYRAAVREYGGSYEPRCMQYPSNRLGAVTTSVCVPETRLLWAPKRSWLKKLHQAIFG